MIVNPVCSITHPTVADVDATYPVPFTYVTVLNVPQITVTLDGTELTYMTDYTLESSGLKLTAEPEAGLELFIERTTPVTQEIDFQTGMIDPDEIEKSFDLSVMREQETQRRVGVIESKIPGEASEDNQLADKAYVDVTDQSLRSDIDTINSKIVAEASSSNKLIDKAYVDSHDQSIQSDVNTHVARMNNPHNTSIVNLIDTSITSPQIGHFLMYDGLKWINTVSSATVGWGTIIGNITDQTDLINKFTEYVRTDGTSTMTAPLLMRATDDFKCAIAPYWDGIGFFKLNDNDSVTLMASIEYNSGFEPAAPNTYNIGASARKWKDLYLAGKAYIPVINNGFDIAVPVTNSADTLALKSQVDDAANSGEQLYTTGVWYAKMYSASVVPTGAEYDGKNYADFSQVDNDNNPIVVIYEGQSGSWVEIARITPPANHVAYLTVTSKIWDIAEQTDQQGGEVLWSYNQKTFTPYPKIVNLLNQANTNLDNLTATGKNIANWSSNVSNCITEIPQDIKLTLTSDGTLTLPVGVKYYFPNGADTFESRTTTVERTITQTTDGTFLVFINSSAFLNVIGISTCVSGTTDTKAGQTWHVWYDTANNVIHRYGADATTPVYDLSLPIAIITASGGQITSIDQVFNGFGYIGSTVFTLPGIKGLVPNGRNDDGTLKSAPVFPATTVKINTPNDGVRSICVSRYSEYTGVPLVGTYVYNSDTNFVERSSDRVVGGYILAGTFTKTSGVITSFEPYTALHAVDYSDYAQTKSDTLTNVSDIAAILANTKSITASSVLNSIVTTTGITKQNIGYVKLGNGLIIQWGYFDVSTTSQPVTFPTAFTSASSYSLAFSYDSTVNNTGNVQDNSINTRTSTGFTTGTVTRTGNAMWIAIGY